MSNPPDFLVEMPQSETYERAVLQLMIDYADIRERALHGLDEEDFHGFSRKVLFRCLKAWPGEELPLLAVEVYAAGIIDEFISTWSNPMFGKASPDYFDFYSEELRSLNVARKAAGMGQRLLTGGTIDSVCKSMKEVNEELSKLEIRKPKKWRSQVADWIDDYQRKMKPPAPPHPQSRWPEWNHTFGGYPDGYYIISGKTSGGKSSLALNIAVDLCRADYRVTYVNCEMPTDHVINRIVADIGSVPGAMMFRPFQFKPPHDKLGKIFAAVNEISKWKLTVIENPPSIESIISTARSAKETKGALIVDYLQLIPDGDLGRKQDSRERRIAAMSAQLRALAIELKWPIIALSQLNDDGQIRESRAVGHDAEIVLEVQDDGIHVHKNRNGQRGQTLTITLEKSHFRFTQGQWDSED